MAASVDKPRDRSHSCTSDAMKPDARQLVILEKSVHSPNSRCSTYQKFVRDVFATLLQVFGLVHASTHASGERRLATQSASEQNNRNERTVDLDWIVVDNVATQDSRTTKATHS